MTLNFVFDHLDYFWFLKTFAYFWGKIDPKILINQTFESLHKPLKMRARQENMLKTSYA